MVSALRQLRFEPLEDRRLLAVGATLLADINLDTVPSDIEATIAVGDLVFFHANSSLYRTDGTAAGTFVVQQGLGGLNAATAVNGVLYYTGATYSGLYRSDGTVAGTKLVADVHVAVNGSMYAIGDTVYFPGNDGGGAGIELWRSDGTAEGTLMVKDIYAGAG